MTSGIPFDDGGPAFPIPAPLEYRLGRGIDGMTLRDWFAGMALVGLIARRGDMRGDEYSSAYAIAEGMLSARTHSVFRDELERELRRREESK
mgnify:FL=1